MENATGNKDELISIRLDNVKLCKDSFVDYYKQWIREPDMRKRTLSDKPCEVFIMGHSLANINKGVLKDFLIAETGSGRIVFEQRISAMSRDYS